MPEAGWGGVDISSFHSVWLDHLWSRSYQHCTGCQSTLCSLVYIQNSYAFWITFGGTVKSQYAMHSSTNTRAYWDWLSGSVSAALLSSLCFLRLVWQGAKKLCMSASSAEILRLGFTVRHLSKRSNRDWGTSSKNSGLLVFIAHQFLSPTLLRNLTSKRSCRNKAMSLEWSFYKYIYKCDNEALE